MNVYLYYSVYGKYIHARVDTLRETHITEEVGKTGSRYLRHVDLCCVRKFKYRYVICNMHVFYYSIL